MNARLKLEDVAERIRTECPTITVGTAYDVTFLRDFPKNFPAAWVIGQRMRPLDNGRGFTGHYRQNVRIEVIVRIVVAKNQALDDVDSRLSVLQDAVRAALIGWKPPNMRMGFVWDLAQDGPAHEGVVTADLIFATETTYQS